MTARAVRKLDFSRKLLLIAAGLIAVAAPIVLGQINAPQSRSNPHSETTPAKPLKFEVASIKPGCPVGNGIIPSADGFHNTCATLHLLIRYAYEINADDRIVGEPDWTKSALYGIEAKVDPADLPAVQLNRHELVLMLQSVLEDRFQLKVHHETRELPVYALVIAKGGSRLKESKPGEPADPPPPVPVGTKDVPGLMLMRKRGTIQAWNSSLNSLPTFLSQELGRPVVDQTGLTGNYDFTLHWTPDMPRGGAAAEDSGPSLFTALQEQLGLRLESTKAPEDVLVVDHVERPSPN